MNIDIAYGKEGLSVEVPDENLVKILRMTEKPVIKNAREVITGKLENPTGTLPAR